MDKESRAPLHIKLYIKEKYDIRNCLKAFHTVMTPTCSVLHIIYRGEKSFVRKT